LRPAPTLPVNAPVDAFHGHRQRPRGHLITFRWMPDGGRVLRTARRAFCAYRRDAISLAAQTAIG